MKILYDHQAFTFQNYGGISRYYSELMNYYQISSQIDFDLSLLYSNNQYLNDDCSIKHKTFFEGFEFISKISMMTILNKRHSIKIVANGNYDVFHPTYYDPYFLGALNGKPYVVTVHDMIHEFFPRNYSIINNTARNKRKLVEQAAGVIAVSNTTKEDIVRFYGIDSERITVVYHATTFPTVNDGHLSIPLPEKYMLYVGDRGVYKNFSFFLNAVGDLIKCDDDLFLVCAGGGPFSSTEKQHMALLGIKNKILHFEIHDEILSVLYHNARAFVFPSLYEGFGIPILEAFASNCPVISSDAGALPEVADSAAVYFDPRDSESIAESVGKVIYDETYRRQLIAEGEKRLKIFSWQKTAEKTEAVYRSVL